MVHPRYHCYLRLIFGVVYSPQVRVGLLALFFLVIRLKQIAVMDFLTSHLHLHTFRTHHPIHLSHPDLRANPNAKIHVRHNQVTHMHRLSEYQNTM
jgi:hypothetical protein